MTSPNDIPDGKANDLLTEVSASIPRLAVARRNAFAGKHDVAETDIIEQIDMPYLGSKARPKTVARYRRRIILVNQPEKPPRPEPTTLALVIKGLALIIGTFLSANVILFLHYPFGH